MSSKQQEREAIEAVARHFSATWECLQGAAASAYLTIDGKRVAVDTGRLARKGRVRQGGGTRPRLRFDRVALGFVRRLQAALADSVPEGRTMLITVTAPIWSASRTAADLTESIREGRTRGTGRLEINRTMHGNRVRARLVEDLSHRASKVVGFVHNPDLNSGTLLSLAESMLRQVGATARERGPRTSAGDRWLILTCDDPFSYVGIYRQVHAQLALPTAFRKVLLVFAGGRVQALTADGGA